MLSWQPRDFHGYWEISFKAKYFTIGPDVRFCKDVPFHEHVDPTGILTNMLNDGVKHGPENHVDYQEMIKDPEDETRM